LPTGCRPAICRKGALGDVFQIRNAKLSPYNQNTAAHPNGYGRSCKLYMQLMYDANKKIVPLTSDSLNWGMEANGFYGDPWTPSARRSAPYFTLPSFEQQGYGTELDQATDVSRHPVLKQFPTRFVRDSKTGNKRLVVLTKDRRHPFVTVTKGEYLQALEAAVLQKYADETQKIARDNKGNQRSIDYFTGYLNTNHAKRLAVSKATRKVQRSPAGDGRNLDAGAWRAPRELCRCVRRQRRFGEAHDRLHDRSQGDRALQDRRAPVDRHVLDSGLERPDQPEPAQRDSQQRRLPVHLRLLFRSRQVKGQPYKPLRSPSFTETVVAGKASEAATKNATDPAVVFFEDFSSSPVGKKPINWHSTLDNTGATSVVTELKGLDGHWAAMAGMVIKPTGMKTPLPRDFEMSYDVVAAQNYRWGARGLILKLSKTVGTPASFSA
jgi:hypothetical protein